MKCLVLGRAALVLVALGASFSCRSVRHDPLIQESVNVIRTEPLREHVEALFRIGPRPIGDVEATRATLDYLTSVLEAYGYQVEEEPFEHEVSQRFVARVRPKGDENAEPIEVEVPTELSASGSQGLAGATQYFATEGLAVESYLLAPLDASRSLPGVNLIATRPGDRMEGRVLELSAHYDTVPLSPGADDNSSGVAVLLEVARVTAALPLERSLRLCFFGGEEVGLVGSASHLARTPAPSALINLDGVGFRTTAPGSQQEPPGIPWFLDLPDQGDFLVVAGKWSSGWLGNLVEGAAATYVPELAFYSANRIGSFFSDAHRSDHKHYWDAGIPAVFLSDTADLRNPNYHRPSDTPETLDYAFLRDVARATAAAAIHWARIRK